MSAKMCLHGVYQYLGPFFDIFQQVLHMKVMEEKSECLSIVMVMQTSFKWKFIFFIYTYIYLSKLSQTKFQISWIYHTIQFSVFDTTVKPLNSGDHWFSEKVSAIERCPLYRGSIHKDLTITGDNWFLREVSAIERCPL